MKLKKILETGLRAVSLSVALSLAWAHSAGAASYQLVDLGVYDGEAAGINNSGQIVGWTYNTYWGSDFAVFWTNSSSPAVVLNAVFPYQNQANAINKSGQIVGWEQLGQNQGYYDEGAFWNNSASTASQLFSYIEGEAFGIDSAGGIVGLAYTASGQEHAAFWIDYAAVPFVDLGTLGGKMSIAYGINDSSQIVGGAEVGGLYQYQHAAYWGSPTSAAADLGSLGGSTGQANAINASGQIVGYADTTNGAQHAAFWNNSSSAAADLGTLGGSASEANAINASGEIVGYADTAGGVEHAAIWSDGTSPPVDLNSLVPANSGWILQAANGINDSGEIVGEGFNPQGNRDAFALIPLPSLNISASGPGTVLVWWLAGSGGFALQTNSDLSTGTWASYGGAVSNTGGTNSVSVAANSASLFFRLYQP